MSLRILHISTRLILGGSQENTVLSCRGQARLGHEVHLAFGPIYGPEGSMLEWVEGEETKRGRDAEKGHRDEGTEAQRGEMERERDGERKRRRDGEAERRRDEEGDGVCGSAGRITTHVVPHMVRRIDPIADLRCYCELKSLIRRIGPDIVHTHSSKAGILGRAAAWSIGRSTRAQGRTGTTGSIGVVHTIHGPPFHRYQSRIKNAVYVLAERLAARRCHLIVSVADAMTRQYLARGIGRPGQYVTVRSGMEIEQFLDAAPGQTRAEVRRALGLGEDDFVIGTVARLAELKGHDDLLDALGEDLRRNRDWKLLWVGDGWWRQRLLKRVGELGLGAQVVTTGLVPPERIPGMIRAMDVLAHPSYREGLPRTVPQALLCGVVPIAYDVDGTGEVCREMETGRLIAPGDTGELREGVRWLHANPEACARLARRGRDECRDAFSDTRMVDELEKVYARALELA